MSSEIHLNDVGTQFLVTVIDGLEIPMDISMATTKEIIFKKPSGVLVTKTASFFTDGTEGKIYYVSQAADLDEIGAWKIQCHVITATSNWHTNFSTFKVHRNL
jgi:hypothetical protein